MAVTPYLLITEVEANQNQKTITINDAFNKIEQALNKKFENDAVGAGPVTLSDSDFTSNGIFTVSGATADFELIVPEAISGNNTQRIFHVRNADTLYSCTVTVGVAAVQEATIKPGEVATIFQDYQTSTIISLQQTSASVLDWRESVKCATTVAGTLASDFEDGDTIDGVTISDGDRILIKDQVTGSENGIYIVQASGAPVRSSDFINASIVSTGAAVIVEEGTVNSAALFVLTTSGVIDVGTTSLTFAGIGSGGSLPYDVGARFKGQPVSEEIIFEYICTRNVTFPAGLSLCQGSVGTAPSALASFSIEANGVSFGNMTFASAQTTATFNSASPQSLAAGDILSIKAPIAADPALSDLVFTLAGVR